MSTNTTKVGASVPEKTKVAGGYHTTTATPKKYKAIFAPVRKKTKKLTAAQKALRALLRPLNDRPRQFAPFVDCALLLDDSGGACITSFDDATACHYFLIWLRQQRATKEAEHKALAIVNARRKRIKLVGGAK